jgi:hypothetical protein
MGFCAFMKQVTFQVVWVSQETLDGPGTSHAKKEVFFVKERKRTDGSTGGAEELSANSGVLHLFCFLVQRDFPFGGSTSHGERAVGVHPRPSEQEIILYLQQEAPIMNQVLSPLTLLLTAPLEFTFTQKSEQNKQVNVRGSAVRLAPPSAKCALCQIRLV